MQEALAKTEIKPPLVDVVANVTAAPVRDPAEIRQLLVAQVCGTVRWRECMGFMHKQGVDLFVEIGAGKVLAGLVKRTAEGARSLNVGVPSDVESFSLSA
jgi:[acyl-carrier-protein] S-malonyltransferase